MLGLIEERISNLSLCDFKVFLSLCSELPAKKCRRFNSEQPANVMVKLNRLAEIKGKMKIQPK